MEARGSLQPLYAIAGQAVPAFVWKSGSKTVRTPHGPEGNPARRSGVVHRFVSRPPGYALHNRSTGHPGQRPPLRRLKPVSAASRSPVIRWIELPDLVAPPLCLCWSLYRVGLPLRAHYSEVGCKRDRPASSDETPPRRSAAFSRSGEGFAGPAVRWRVSDRGVVITSRATSERPERPFTREVSLSLPETRARVMTGLVSL